MFEQLRLLLDLQKVDADLLKVEAELKALPKELNGRESELKRCKEAVASNKDQIKKSQSEAHSMEVEIKGREEKIAKLDGECNKVRDNAQLMALQHQMKTLREEISQFEDKTLALFSKIESLEADGKKLQADVAAAEQEFAGFKKNVDIDIAARNADKKQLQDKRAGMIAGINKEIYDKYMRLLTAREGQAMAMVEGQVCQGCNMEVVTNDYVKILNAKELVHCRHCNRILYILSTESGT